ncbi:MAG TPA: hypothetical protein VJY62_19525 [Bacteroidia bacterium]|nr:hypothetical protein [Bacteroidia bacterium]
MKKIILAFVAISALNTAMAQTAKDLFTTNDVKISWLGLDFSHTKLIGSFNQIGDAVQTSPSEVRSKYFPAWNQLIVNEQKKFDIKGALRKDDIFFDIDMMMDKNAKAPLEQMEANNPPGYKQEDIAKFVKEYQLKEKTGIGVAFVVESFNKGGELAIVHFVAINNATKDILIYERIEGKPQGFGIRNYWAGAIFSVIKKIKSDYYKTWQSKYGQ